VAEIRECLNTQRVQSSRRLGVGKGTKDLEGRIHTRTQRFRGGRGQTEEGGIELSGDAVALEPQIKFGLRWDRPVRN